MKRILFITLILTLLTSILCTSCRKYEDGPGFSLASKKSRVVGVWEIEKEIYSVGYDETEVTSNPLWPTSVEFTKDGKVESVYNVQGVPTTYNAYWDFADGMKERRFRAGFVNWPPWGWIPFVERNPDKRNRKAFLFTSINDPIYSGVLNPNNLIPGAYFDLSNGDKIVEILRLKNDELWVLAVDTIITWGHYNTVETHYKKKK